jgi:hypothetical protein
MKEDQGITVEYKVNVDKNGNAKITGGSDKIRLGLDSVKYASNDKRTAIVFVKSSPFQEVSPGEILHLDAPKGPFKYVNKGKHHFDCGYLLNPKPEDGTVGASPTGNFQRWGGNQGGDTPGGPR